LQSSLIQLIAIMKSPWTLLHLILYEVSHHNFYHIDGVFSWDPWNIWMDLEVHTFMEPLLFLTFDYFMEIFGGYFMVDGYLVVWCYFHTFA
jgi:hypothetical protein